MEEATGGVDDGRKLVSALEPQHTRRRRRDAQRRAGRLAAGERLQLRKRLPVLVVDDGRDRPLPGRLPNRERAACPWRCDVPLSRGRGQDSEEHGRRGTHPTRILRVNANETLAIASQVLLIRLTARCRRNSASSADDLLATA
jgi:hypothetical protein